MKTIYRNGMRLKCDCKILPPKGYSAITLFGTVYTKKTEEEIDWYLLTINGKKWLNHERIHCEQKKETHNSWVVFYLLYLWYFFKMWPFCTANWSLAYATIPFEMEAKQNEHKMGYTSKWMSYVYPNSWRKAYEYKWRNTNNIIDTI